MMDEDMMQGEADAGVRVGVVFVMLQVNKRSMELVSNTASSN